MKLRKSLMSMLPIVFVATVALASTRTVEVDQFKSSDRTKTWALPAASDTLTGRASNDTLTNKSIDADNNTITNIDNNEIKAAAGIALNKLAASTASKAAVYDASGFLTASTVSSASLAFLDATSSVQTQLDGKQPLDGDLTALAALAGTNTIYYRSAANTWSPVSIGSGLTFAAGSIAASGSAADARDVQVFVDSGNGHGATDTKVRRFSNIRHSSGSSITYADSSTAGGTFTVTAAGVYIACYGDFSSGGVSSTAITVNSSATTTSATTPLTFAQGKRGLHIGETNSESAWTCWGGNLAINDVIRAQDDGSNSGTDARAYFFITKVADSGGEFYLENGNGRGSTNTNIRKFSNVRVNSGGSDMTLTQSSVNGDSITINAAGTYFICHAESGSTHADGVTVNDSALGTDISTSTYANGKRSFATGGSAESVDSCVVLPLAVNDVVREKGDSGSLSTDTSTGSYLFIVKIGTYTDGGYFENGAGHASVNTKYRTFTDIQNSAGSDVYASKSAVVGSEFSVQTAGNYVACYFDRWTSNAAVSGIIVSGRVPTTSVATPLDYASGLRTLDIRVSTNESTRGCYAGFLSSGQFVSASDSGSNNNTGISSYFAIGRAN